jgi:hypothetical protein
MKIRLSIAASAAALALLGALSAPASAQGSATSAAWDCETYPGTFNDFGWAGPFEPCGCGDAHPTWLAGTEVRADAG